jgi:hypothetical protein
LYGKDPITSKIVEVSDLTGFTGVGGGGGGGGGGAADSSIFSTNYRRDTALTNVRAEKLSVEIDGDISNELQVLDVAQLVGTDLQLSLEGDGEATKVIDLSSLQGGSGNIIVNTIADLKLLTDTTDNTKVTVLGYWANFDGNGGEFIYDSGNVTTDNDGTIIKGTGFGGRWLRVVNENYLSLKWFGAVGDSSTNETTKIQAWQAALVSEQLNGYIPEGNYVYSDPAQNPIKYENLKIYGDGAKSSFVTRNAKTIFCLDSLSNNVYFRNFRVLVEDESGGGIGSTDGVFACPQGNSQYLTWEKIIIKSEGKLDSEVGMNAIAFRSQYNPYVSDSISHVTIKDCDFYLGGRNNYGIYFLIKTTDFYIENTNVLFMVILREGK